jgi:hypothetical protein
LYIAIQAIFKSAKVGATQVLQIENPQIFKLTVSNLLDFADLLQNFALSDLQAQSFL